MSQQLYSLSLDAIKYICNLINQTVDLPSTILDDLHIATNTTYSSYRLDTLLKALKDENIKYCDEAIAGLNKLTKEIVDDSSKVVKENTIYLILTNPVNNVYEQWLLINGTPQMIGTTEMNLDSVYTKQEADARYTLITDFDALKTTVDKKVNKTDVVDNLTSTDTDKPLSANQGKVLKDEVDLKANDSDVVKKTDIVTTIDNTSTDDTIPSTKAVYDKINPIVIKSISTSYDSDTIENYLETITPNTDVLFVSNSTTGELVTLTGQHLFLIEYRKVANLFLQRAYQAIDGKLIACRSKNWWNNTWSKWQKVCTTSVADVARKTITNPSNVTSGTISYAISNGICSVEIIGITPDGTGGVTIPLPKSLYYTVGLLVDPTGTPVGSACGGTNGAFNIIDISGTTALYGGFSYPVAES